MRNTEEDRTNKRKKRKSPQHFMTMTNKILMTQTRREIVIKSFKHTQQKR